MRWLFLLFLVSCSKQEVIDNLKKGTEITDALKEPLNNVAPGSGAALEMLGWGLVGLVGIIHFTMKGDPDGSK